MFVNLVCLLERPGRILRSKLPKDGLEEAQRRYVLLSSRVSRPDIDILHVPDCNKRAEMKKILKNIYKNKPMDSKVCVLQGGPDEWPTAL
jgi:hypothetical protein